MTAEASPPLRDVPTFGVVPTHVTTRDTGLAFLNDMIARRHPSPPFAGATDNWLTTAEYCRVVFEAGPSDRFLNPLGTVHDGWISTLLDSAMGCAVHSGGRMVLAEGRVCDATGKLIAHGTQTCMILKIATTDVISGT